MASVFKDSKTKGAWIASFKPYGWRKGMPYKQKYVGIRPKKQALSMAREFEYICSELQTGDPSQEIIAKAIKKKLITPDQAETFADRGVLPEMDLGRPTIKKCYDDHPTTRHEDFHSPRAKKQHDRDLKIFKDWAGVEFQDQVTFDMVVRYQEYLVDQGLSWETRRHRLSVIRRACAMAARQYGMADPLYRSRINPRRGNEQIRKVETFQLGDLHRACRQDLEPRQRAVIILGGFHGLRSSEIFRVQAGDYDPRTRTLTVGLRERKTSTSYRQLPLAKTASLWMRRLTRSMDPEELLVHPASWCERGDGKFRSDTFGSWCAKWLPEATGRQLPPSALRKTWATEARRRRIEGWLIDLYMGHQPRDVAAVTTQHYTDLDHHELLPVAEEIQKWLRPSG